MRESENNAIFELQKVKITKDGGLAINYTMVEQKENETYVNKHRIQATNEPHTDLLAQLQRLQPLMAEVFGMPENQIAIDGVTIGGKNESEGAIITGIFTTIAGQTTSIATPRIKFATSYYGFESELADAIAEIEKEVYLYLFEEKTAELDTFNAD